MIAFFSSKDIPVDSLTFSDDSKLYFPSVISTFDINYANFLSLLVTNSANGNT